MDGLRQKLEQQGLQNVTYIVVNHQGEHAQRLHSMLEQRLSDNITLYKQEAQQPDVWQSLNGDKDDFLFYDRCGRLTEHLSLPYTIIGKGHIEGAIRNAYCKRTCGNCTYESSEVPEECNRAVEVKPEGDATPTEADTGQGHRHGHGHGHGHGHHHGNHGVGHGHDLGHGHGQHHGHGQRHGHGGQQQFDLSQMAQMPQDAQGGPLVERP